MISNTLHAATASLSRGVTETEDLRRLANTDEKAALREATQQFEGLFIQMMLKTMRSTADQDGLFSSSALKSFREMQDSEMAKQIAAGGGLGLTQQVMDSVLRQARIEPDTPTPSASVSAEQDTLSHLQGRGVESTP